MNDNIEKNLNNTSVPEWQHPVLPGQALQGSLLLTVTDFNNPPQSSSQFIWMLMDEIIGVANVKLVYNEETNTYTIYKAKGHLLNNLEWTYNWEPIGSFAGLTEETKQALESLVYIEYNFENNNNTLIVKGKKKDGSWDTLLSLEFVSPTDFNNAINNLQTEINQEITNRQTADDSLANSLAQEIVDRTAADTQQQAEITQIQNGLQTEITQRTTADTQLQNKINDEAIARAGEVNTLRVDTNSKFNIIENQLNNTLIIDGQTSIVRDPSGWRYTLPDHRLTITRQDFLNGIFYSNPDYINLYAQRGGGQLFFDLDFSNITQQNGEAYFGLYDPEKGYQFICGSSRFKSVATAVIPYKTLLLYENVFFYSTVEGYIDVGSKYLTYEMRE